MTLVLRGQAAAKTRSLARVKRIQTRIWRFHDVGRKGSSESCDG